VVGREKHPTRDAEVSRAAEIARTGRKDGKTDGPDGRVDRTYTTGWAPTCACPPDDSRRCTVLDPFSGSGSTGVAALRNGRRYIGIDLKDEYHAIARRRLERAHYETAYGVRHERERVADGQLPMFVSSAGEGPG